MPQLIIYLPFKSMSFKNFTTSILERIKPIQFTALKTWSVCPSAPPNIAIQTVVAIFHNLNV